MAITLSSLIIWKLVTLGGVRVLPPHAFSRQLQHVGLPSHQWEPQPCTAGHLEQLRSKPERLLIGLAGWQLNLSEGEEN